MARNRQRYIGIVYMLLLFVTLGAWVPIHAEQAQAPGDLTSSQPVYVIPVEQTIETGLGKFLRRAFAEAEQTNARLIVLDIDTLGGRVDSANDIGTLIRDSKIETIAFIRGRAISAGSYIALNADRIVMKPGSSIGAAAVVDIKGERVKDAKTIAYWAGEMRSAAELNGRNAQIAMGMVDEDIVVEMPEIGKTKQKGEIISLSANEALKVGYAEHLAKDIDELLTIAGAEGHRVIDVSLSPAESLARWLTHPVVATLLLLIGIAGIAIEIIVPGFGLPGIAGLVAFALYFFGHYAAGFAGNEDIFMFIAGIVLMVVELFIPGFGIFGIAGVICLISGVVMAAYSTGTAVVSLSVALVVAIIVVAIVVKVFKHRGIWNRFILKDEMKSELGYVSAKNRDDLLGLEGESITPLRPAGTAMIGGERVDVVTSGEYIPAKRPITVIYVEGTRVVVKEVTE